MFTLRVALDVLRVTQSGVALDRCLSAPPVRGPDGRKMQRLLWPLFQAPLALQLGVWRAPRLSRVSSRPPSWAVPGSSSALTHRAPRGLRGFTQDWAQRLAGPGSSPPEGWRGLLGQAGPSSHLSGQQWTVRPQTGQTVASDHLGRHLLSCSSGQPSPGKPPRPVTGLRGLTVLLGV